MSLDKESIVTSLKAEIVRIASAISIDAAELQRDEVIPASGLIDSAGLLELIAWFESNYDFSIPTDDFTIDNLGTLDLMADYLLRRKESAR